MKSQFPDKVEAQWNVNEDKQKLSIGKALDKVEAQWNVNLIRDECCEGGCGDKVEAQWNVNTRLQSSV